MEVMSTSAEIRDIRRPIAPRLLRTLIVFLLFVPVAVVALGSGLGIIPLPFEMFVLAENMPVIFRAHMVTAAFALLIAPVVIAVRHRRDIHRMLGRLLGAFVVAGGLTALPVAIFSHSGMIARAGFFVQGLVWIALFIAGVIAIRRGDRRRHAMFMVAMVAVTTGAVWFRLMIGTAIALSLPFEPVYAFAAWAAWMAPLTLVGVYPRFVAKALA